MTDFTLNKHPRFPGVPGPLLLVIMDGVGLYRGRRDGYDGNAFDLAKTPELDRLFAEAPVFMKLKAHGTAVGLPSDDDMGNSEVGHNAMGAGRVFAQGAKLVTEAIASGKLYEGSAWKEVTQAVNRENSTLHFIGLLSDGNVHSHIDHLLAMLAHLDKDGIRKVRIHPLADGRDVDPVTYHVYLETLEAALAELRKLGIDAAIASGGGRMAITMDRYNADWSMVQRGWQTHVLGQGRMFTSALQAVETLRAEKPGVIDQDLPGFVVADENGKPLGPIVDGDAVVFYNFRGDRAIEISRAFTEQEFKEFDRERFPRVTYAGMMQYDGDLKLPPRYLVEPPAISETVSEYLARNGVTQLAAAETQKYGHVTYFWNGNNSEKFDAKTETWIEVPSDRIAFEYKPEMKAREVTEKVIQELETGRHRFVRVNLANGDMVGHTGVLSAAITAMEVVDECVGRLCRTMEKLGGTMIVTADHGNLDQMLEIDKKSGGVKKDKAGNMVVKTSHTLSPVPWLLFGREAERFAINPQAANPGLGNLASTLLLLLGYEAPQGFLPPLVTLK